jgi:hypothetical protein
VKKHSAGTAAISACLLLLQTSCSDQQPGNPVAATNSTKPSTTSGPANVFAGLKSCEILNDAVASESGFKPGEEDNISSDNGCQTSKREFGATNLELDDKQGLAQFAQTSPSNTEIQVNGRKGLEYKHDSLACDLALAVTTSSRMLITVQFLPSVKQDPCEFATKVATAAEPKLPKVN